MTLRTTAIIAGALGLLMLVAGLVAQALRPEPAVVTKATLDTPVVVLGPEVLALPGLERLAVTATGGVVAHTARPVDAQAWLAQHSATVVTGYASWEELTTRTAARIDPDNASHAPSPTAEPSPSPGSDAAATGAPKETYEYGSDDVWRRNWTGVGRVSVAVPAISPGEYFVANSVDGSNLGTVEISAQRQVNDAWISPLIWLGTVLAILGALAAVSALIDVRPVQERVESWTTKRSRVAVGEQPKPGSRRERRLAGSTLPDVEVDEKGQKS